MRWEEGREVVERLLADGELDRVSADLASASSLLESARRHLDSARKIRESDAEGSYAALYDAARKACAALLEAQGLRATSRGGHIALREAIITQFALLSGGQVFRAFDRLRRRRNDIEYPDGDSGIDINEVDEALLRSSQIVELAEKLVEHLPVYTR
jgi:hypothetical protein